jgi:hypothetical protein
MALAVGLLVVARQHGVQIGVAEAQLARQAPSTMRTRSRVSIGNCAGRSASKVVCHSRRPALPARAGLA